MLAERVSHTVTAHGTELATGGGTAAVYAEPEDGAATQSFENPTDGNGTKVAPVAR